MTTTTATTKTDRPKRERHVFPTDEIAHLWAHQTQSDARNQQGNFYFTGATIYSYGSHFPIAKHVTNKRGKKAILFTTRSYSNTTGGHIAAVRQAIPAGVTVFKVYSIQDWQAFKHAENLKAFADVAKDKVETAKRSRKNGSSELAAAFGLQQTAIEYGKFFSVKFPKADWKFLPKGEELAELTKKLSEREARAKVLDDAANARQWARWEAEQSARKAEADRWNASGICTHTPKHDANEWGAVVSCDGQRDIDEWEAKSADIIAAWKAGDTCARLRNTYDLPVYLRVMGGEIETSKGARIPLAHAVRGLKFVRAVVGKGEDWVKNGHTFHLGHYSLDRVEANGTVHAGCHVIGLDEIERIAPDVEQWERAHAAEVIAADNSAGETV